MPSGMPIEKIENAPVVDEIRVDRLDVRTIFLRRVDAGHFEGETFILSERAIQPHRTTGSIFYETGVADPFNLAEQFDRDFPLPIRGISYPPPRSELENENFAQLVGIPGRKDCLVWYCRVLRRGLSDRALNLTEIRTLPILEQITNLFEDRMALLRKSIVKENVIVEALVQYVEFAVLYSNLAFYKNLIAIGSQRQNMIEVESFSQLSLFLSKIMPI